MRSVRRLRGGTSSAVHAIEASREALFERFVLRRFVREDWLAEEPDVAAHEAAALRLLEATDLPVPRLVAHDEDGSDAGVPAVLATRLPGRPVLSQPDLRPWLAAMAQVLPRIHALRPSERDFSYTYAPYYRPDELHVPEWSNVPTAWERAIAVARQSAPAAKLHLIHRDYHPANLLWVRGRISGVVDWVNACVGPAGVDIGHCRRNLALLHGVEVADQFLLECLHWAPYDPYWDLVTLLDALPDTDWYAGWPVVTLDLTPEVVRQRADAYVTSLVARL